MTSAPDTTTTICTEQAGTIIFANAWLALTFDRATGRWLTLDHRPSNTRLLDHGGRLAPLTLTVGGVTTATRGRAQWDSLADTTTIGLQTTCDGYDLDDADDHATLTLVTEEGDWQIEQTYTLDAAMPRLTRGLRLTYRGSAPALLRDVTLRLPPAVLGTPDGCSVEAPGYPAPPHLDLGALPLGEDWDGTIGKPFGVGWEPGLLGLVNAHHALATWCHDETQPTMLRVCRVDAGAQARHIVMLARRFQPNSSLDWQGQLVQAEASDWQTLLAQLHPWYERIDLRAPTEPAWGKSARIYEVFVGEQPVGEHASRRSAYQTLDDLTADLPRIQALGCNVIQLMPHMPFPSYSVFDYLDVDVQYGSAAGLRRLVQAAHARRMKVLLDVIVHGVFDREAATAMNASIAHGWAVDERLPQRHPYRVAHPEWFMQTDTGEPAATYTWAFDHANPGWRRFIIDVFCYYVTEFDVDGFRVDALTWNLFPNWAEGLPYHASASIYGSRAMSEQLRAALHAIKPDVILYTETTDPIFARAYDLVYNYDMQWIFSALARPIARRGFAYTFAKPTITITARELAAWLAQRRSVLPPGMTTVHHLDSHDSHEWGRLLQYRAEAFGDAVARAFFALCCALEGGVMLFAGAEYATATDGSVTNRSATGRQTEAHASDQAGITAAFYTRWLHFKRDCPALHHGAADYTAVTASSPHVLAPLRTAAHQSLIPVIHLHDATEAVTLHVPAAALHTQVSQYRLVNLWTGATLDGPNGATWTADDLEQGITLTLAPYATHLLEATPA